MQERTKKIIEKLAKKYNLTPREAEYAVKVYYEKLKGILGQGNFPEEDTFKPILIPSFGRFLPNKNKIKKHYARQRENDFRKQFDLLIPGSDIISGIYSGGEEDQTIQHK